MTRLPELMQMHGEPVERIDKVKYTLKVSTCLLDFLGMGSLLCNMVFTLHNACFRFILTNYVVCQDAIVAYTHIQVQSVMINFDM